MALISCKDLCVGYGGVPVACGITCEVLAGDMLCVIGENGAGKSTLIKTLVGALVPLSGRLDFGEGLGPGQIGYLPQRDDSQRDFPASVWEVALSGCLSQMGRRPFFGNRERASASKNLERLGVAGLKDRPFGRLSGGQQQRVLIARALCAASRLLIMDEPTTGLDPDAAGSLYATLDGLREEGMAIVAVVHDVGSALGHATHVLHVRAKGSDFHPTKAGRAGEGEKNDG